MPRFYLILMYTYTCPLYSPHPPNSDPPLCRQGAGERDEKADEAALKEKKAKAGVSLFDSKRVQGTRV